MAWDENDLKYYEDIVQEGVFAYNFNCSGTIYKGQAVTILPKKDLAVMVTEVGTGKSEASNAIGFAAYTMTGFTSTTGDNAKKMIAIYGPGNIVWACCDTGEDIVPGTYLYGDTDGILDADPGNAKKIAGIALCSGNEATTNQTVKILVV